jgi:hypothetical protein
MARRMARKSSETCSHRLVPVVSIVRLKYCLRIAIEIKNKPIQVPLIEVVGVVC